MLVLITGDYERCLLYKNNNININKFIKIDNAATIKYLENDISRYSRCPACYINNITSNYNEKVELFKLKCNHSFCNNCIIKYCKNKCYLC